MLITLIKHMFHQRRCLIFRRHTRQGKKGANVATLMKCFQCVQSDKVRKKKTNKMYLCLCQLIFNTQDVLCSKEIHLATKMIIQPLTETG